MIALLAVVAATAFLVGYLRGWCVGFDEGREHSARWVARAVEDAYRKAGAVSQADLRKAVDV